MKLIPKVIIFGLIAIQVVASFVLDGKPRPSAAYNGTILFGDALVLFALLGWAGFWESDE